VARLLRVVGIVDEIVVTAGRITLLFRKNQDGVVKSELLRKRCQVKGEQFPPCQRCLQICVRFLLIAPALDKEHPIIPQAPISRPAMTDRFLQKETAPFTHFAEVGIAWKNNALILGQWLAPGRARRHHANSLHKGTIVQRRRLRIKTREFVKLYRGPTQNEATPGITTLLCFRSQPQMNNYILVLVY